MSLPDDLILNAADEVAIRQHLALVALGKRPGAHKRFVSVQTGETHEVVW
jgi:hypothetical protein